MLDVDGANIAEELAERESEFASDEEFTKKAVYEIFGSCILEDRFKSVCLECEETKGKRRKVF